MIENTIIDLDNEVEVIEINEKKKLKDNAVLKSKRRYNIISYVIKA